VPLAYVQTFVAQGATMTIDGTGFANPLGSLFTPNGYVGPLTPLSGGTASRIRIVVPAGVPTSPGALQVVNAPRFIASNAASVPIGTGVRDHIDHQHVHRRRLLRRFRRPAIPLTMVSATELRFTVRAGAVSGGAFVQIVNPPYIFFTSSGCDPDGVFSLVVP
jgi:hypothetical protein